MRRNSVRRGKNNRCIGKKTPKAWLRLLLQHHQFATARMMTVSLHPVQDRRFPEEPSP